MPVSCGHWKTLKSHGIWNWFFRSWKMAKLATVKESFSILIWLHIEQNFIFSLLKWNHYLLTAKLFMWKMRFWPWKNHGILVNPTCRNRVNVSSSRIDIWVHCGWQGLIPIRVDMSALWMRHSWYDMHNFSTIICLTFLQ